MFLVFYNDIKNIPVSDYLLKKEIEIYRKKSFLKKKDWIAGRFIVKSAISSYFFGKFKKRIDFKDIEIVSQKFKKPVCRINSIKNEKIDLRISHCDGFAIADASEKKIDFSIGIDIQKIRNFSYNTTMSFLSEKELAWLKKIKPEKRAMAETLFWSLKESYLKAKGTGLVYHPKFVEFNIDFKKKSGKIYDKGVEKSAKIKWSIFLKKYVITRVEVIKINRIKI